MDMLTHKEIREHAEHLIATHGVCSGLPRDLRCEFCPFPELHVSCPCDQAYRSALAWLKGYPSSGQLELDFGGKV